MRPKRFRDFSTFIIPSSNIFEHYSLDPLSYLKKEKNTLFILCSGHVITITSSSHYRRKTQQHNEFCLLNWCADWPKPKNAAFFHENFPDGLLFSPREKAFDQSESRKQAKKPNCTDQLVTQLSWIVPIAKTCPWEVSKKSNGQFAFDSWKVVKGGKSELFLALKSFFVSEIRVVE